MILLTTPSCEDCGFICECRDLPRSRELECTDCRRRADIELDNRLDRAMDCED